VGVCLLFVVEGGGGGGGGGVHGPPGPPLNPPLGLPFEHDFLSLILCGIVKVRLCSTVVVVVGCPVKGDC